MKRTFLYFVLAAVLLPSVVRSETVILDLTHPTTPLTFNSETGAATLTYDEDIEQIESQCFVFLHGALSEYQSWWGFTASNSTDNSVRQDHIKYQFSNMAMGGLVLNEDGTVETDEDGVPTVSAQVPYLVAYYSPYMSRRPIDMVFNDDRLYTARSAYFNLNSYTYYTVVDGDAFARAFHNGDKYTVTIHGVGADDSETAMDLDMATFVNGDLTTTRGWKKVDLSPLGNVKEIYFTISSTDTGDWGMNTPGYFCMDKLEVEPVSGSAVEAPVRPKTEIRYLRRSATVLLDGPSLAIVYDITGRKMMAVEADSFSVADLPAGVYTVKAGNSVLKIVR